MRPAHFPPLPENKLFASTDSDFSAASTESSADPDKVAKKSVSVSSVRQLTPLSRIDPLPLRENFMGKKICARRRFDKAILTRAQVTRKIQVPRDRRPDAIKLRAQLPVRCLCHLRHCHRESFVHRPPPFERDIFARHRCRHAYFLIVLQSDDHLPKRFLPMDQYIGIHDDQILR